MKGKYTKYYHFNPLDIRPSWFLRWGITIVFLFLIMMVLSSSFVPYNDVVVGEAIITSRNPPSRIKAKKSGRIQSIFFQPGDSISTGTILGIIESTGSYSDILDLKEKLGGDLQDISSVEELLLQYPQYLNLTVSIQLAYNSFNQAYQEIILDSAYNEVLTAIELLDDNSKTQEARSDIKAKELEVAERNIENLQNNFQRSRILFSKGVISRAELEKIENEYLNSMDYYFAIEEDVVETKENIRRTSRNKRVLINRGNRSTEEKHFRLRTTQEVLRAEIKNWEEQFVLKSPIDGKLSFNNIWGNFQNVEAGETVFTVVPFETNGYIGKCIVPVRNSGKIKQGRKVSLKLSNFPHTEWGNIKATVGSISEGSVSLENPGFIVYLNLVDLKTSFGRTIEYNRELSGTAEIFLEEVSLFERFFYRLTHLLSTTS